MKVDGRSHGLTERYQKLTNGIVNARKVAGN